MTDTNMKMPRNSYLERLSLEELDDRATEFNALVSVTPEVDLFCSSTFWSIPAHLAFGRVRSVRIHRSEQGFFALALGYRLTHGFVMEPLEAVWGAACPLIGPEPEALVESFEREFRQLHRWRVPLMLSGIQPDGRLFRAIKRQLAARWELRLGPTTRSFRASLEGGPDAFLSRRTRKFRANLRREVRAAEDRGITFEYYSRFANSDELLALYDRIIQVETQSWKGRLGTGLAEPAMMDFYRHMLSRIWPRQVVRVMIARHDEQDVGYVFGAQMEGIYRGLQISYDHRFSDVGLGNVLQWQSVQKLCEEPCFLYDLGIEVAYKARWGEDIFETVLLVAE